MLLQIVCLLKRCFWGLVISSSAISYNCRVLCQVRSRKRLKAGHSAPYRSFPASICGMTITGRSLLVVKNGIRGSPTLGRKFWFRTCDPVCNDLQLHWLVMMKSLGCVDVDLVRAKLWRPNNIWAHGRSTAHGLYGLPCLAFLYIYI